jgi:hypothetical protein
VEFVQMVDLEKANQDLAYKHGKEEFEDTLA